MNSVTNGGITKQLVNYVWSCLDDLAVDYIQNNNERRPGRPLERVTDDSSSSQVIAMLQTLSKRFDRLEAHVDRNNSRPMGAHAIYAQCDYCGEAHATDQCHLSQQIETVNYARNYRASSFSAKPIIPPSFPQVKKWYIPIQELKVDLEDMMAKLMSSQIKSNQEQAAINTRVDSSLKNLEVQMGQIATAVTALHKGGLPSNTETNPHRKGNEECKAITLRSGKQLSEISSPTPKSTPKPKVDQTKQEVSSMPPKDKIVIVEDDIKKDSSKVVVKTSKKEELTSDHLTWVPPLPFPQRFQRKALEEQYRKFLGIFKLHINIPLIKALEQMPQYAKFLKEMLSKKRRLGECEMVALTEECSAILLNKLPPKFHDQGSFSIPCVIGDKFQGGALCDLGSSINLMPLFMFRKLQLGEASPTLVTLQLADRSLAFPKGKIEDVLVKVDKFIFPIDFIVLDCDEDRDLLLIVGRPFLATARSLIDVGRGEIKLRVNDEEVSFNMHKAIKYPREYEICSRVDILDEVV
ncbi:uncharacterized protein LOC129309374 [Prosopis cineraria]|uniref:uncharacterized protein LOC129309374 n=1 Tax=Prosopis cineraria TaxID=364024 RepID=UPI00240FDE7A|nr:uncharacterized protein LOC129309374 [Prosopis cineraria]